MMDQISNEKVGQFIACLRREQQLTQRQLAERLYVSDKAVSKWERGLNFPDLGLIEPLAAALGTSAAALLGLAQHTPDQTVAAVSGLAAQEREQVRRQIRLRARLTLGIGLILFAAQIAASKFFADNGLYGLPQMLTAGMLGFTGTLIGGAVYTLKNARRL